MSEQSPSTETAQWTFDDAVKSIMSARKQSADMILDNQIDQPLIKPGKSIKIGKHCTKDDKGNLYFKKASSHSIGRALQVGIAFDCLKARQEIRAEDMVTPKDFQGKKEMLFPSAGGDDTPPHDAEDFTFHSIAPQGFQYFRKVFKIPDQEYAHQFVSKPLKCVANPGGSGALMWFTHSGEYVIKTVDRGQAKFLQKMLLNYYMNIKENPDTLLTRFYGLYAVKLWNNPAKRIRIVVMKNFFPIGVKFDYKFDLKGSRINRFASNKEKQKDSPTLKDIDFDEFFPSGINLEQKYYEQLQKATRRDTYVLESCNIFDYSFLLAIVKPTNQKIIEDLKRMECQGSPLDRVMNSGGVPATNEKGEYIYLYWGVVDMLQEYDLAHKYQYCWKAVKHGCKKLPEVSVQPPEAYKMRYTKYILDRVFKEVHNVEIEESKTEKVNKKWKHAVAAVIRDRNGN